MQSQSGSIWGNINLCIEIALNIYYMVGEHGEGIMIPREHAVAIFSDKTVAAGKESEGCLYYPKGETMDMPLYEMMQKRAAMARKIELAAAARMAGIREKGQGAVSALFEDAGPPAHLKAGKRIREGIYMTGGEEPLLAIHEKAAYFMSPYACEFGRNEGGYLYYTLQSAAIPLYDLKEVFPECREMILSEESLCATICTHYPAYREEYNAVVPEEEQIPQISAPANLFLQEQLDRVRTEERMQEDTQGEGRKEMQTEMQTEEERDEEDYGEQVDWYER